MSATKHDQGKARFDLLPIPAILEIIKVLQYGAVIHGEWNWKKGMSYSRLYSASQRHLTSWWSGQSFDPESRINHLAHAACSLLFLMCYEIDEIGNDDRCVESSDSDDPSDDPIDNNKQEQEMEKNKKPKSTFRTTEFLATVFTTLGTLCAAIAGVLDPKYAAIATACAVFSYNISRGFAKNSGFYPTIKK